MREGKFGGREVVIVEAVRTPIGRGHEEKGYYKDVHPSNLLAKTYSVIDRAGIDASEVEDVVAGCVQQFGEQMNIGRNAWLEAGLPIETPDDDRSPVRPAQQGVNFAAALVASGVHDVAIGTGVEHMGHISLRRWHRGHERARHGLHAGADGALSNLIPQGSRPSDRRQMGDPRSELDKPSVPSHQLAARRPRRGPLRAREIAPLRRSTATPTSPTRASVGPTSGGLIQPEAGVQGGRQDLTRQLSIGLRRRRRPCC